MCEWECVDMDILCLQGYEWTRGLYSAYNPTPILVPLRGGPCTHLLPMLQRKNQAHGLVSNLALKVIVMVVFLVQFFSLSSGPNYYPILLPRLLLATWNIDHTTLRQLLFLLSWSVTQSSPVPP